MWRLKASATVRIGRLVCVCVCVRDREREREKFFYFFLIKKTEIWIKRGSEILVGRLKFFEWEARKYLGAPIVAEIKTYCGSFKTTVISLLLWQSLVILDFNNTCYYLLWWF